MSAPDYCRPMGRLDEIELQPGMAGPLTFFGQSADTRLFSDELYGLGLQSGAEPPCHRVRNLTSWFYKREGVTTGWTGVFPQSHDI